MRDVECICSNLRNEALKQLGEREEAWPLELLTHPARVYGIEIQQITAVELRSAQRSEQCNRADMFVK